MSFALLATYCAIKKYIKLLHTNYLVVAEVVNQTDQSFISNENLICQEDKVVKRLELAAQCERNLQQNKEDGVMKSFENIFLEYKKTSTGLYRSCVTLACF